VHVAVAQTSNGPHYFVDPLWPKDLPDTWTLGQVGGIAVDNEDNVWIVHRPNTLVDDERGAQKSPPETRCCQPAPPVLQFAPDGKLLKGWGGPGQAYDWPKNEHGVHIDGDGNVWLAGPYTQGGSDQCALKRISHGSTQVWDEVRHASKLPGGKPDAPICHDWLPAPQLPRTVRRPDNCGGLCAVEGANSGGGHRFAERRGDDRLC
jgi:hypothetical protein